MRSNVLVWYYGTGKIATTKMAREEMALVKMAKEKMAQVKMAKEKRHR